VADFWGSDVTLIFTCGDPLSINIEAFLRVVVPSMSRHRAVIGIGNFWQLLHQAKALDLRLPQIHQLNSLQVLDQPGVFWLDPLPDAPKIDARSLSELDRGRIAIAALEAVPKSTQDSMAVLTAPVNKKSMSLAGFEYPGQTEFFERNWGAGAVMMLAGPQLRVALATNHLRLKDIADHVSMEMIVQKLKVTHAASMRLFGIARPKIAVCGLNPHCGDRGLFGDEETKFIEPAIEAAKSMSINVSGPYPADTVFYRAMRGEFDVVLAMYHDQGLGPLKTVHFDEAVNISMGLPYLRVSPDHGPAADLYLTGRASVKSFDIALKFCERWLSSHKL
jgi:4-hydroxythreonine-4-phosphate dehydrogenase